MGAIAAALVTVARRAEAFTVRGVLGLPIEWRVALSLGLAVVAGYALLTDHAHHWTSDARVWQRVLHSPAAPRLSIDGQRRARTIAESVDGRLRQEWLDRDDGGLRYIPWTMAQVAMSLPPTEITRAEVAEFFGRHRAGCACWKGNDTSPNVIATSWALMALSRVGDPLSHDAAAWLAGAQRADGSWALYALDDPRLASTAATALALLAMEAYVRGLGAPGPDGPAPAAIRRGRQWLEAHERDGGWSLYPRQEESRLASASPAVSALAVHALWRTRQAPAGDDLAPLVRRWLSKAPALPERPEVFDRAGLVLGPPASGAEVLMDRVRNYATPWTVITLVDVYPRATAVERFRALEVLEAFVSRSVPLGPDFQHQTWLVAETQLALRYLLGERVL